MESNKMTKKRWKPPVIGDTKIIRKNRKVDMNKGLGRYPYSVSFDEFHRTVIIRGGESPVEPILFDEFLGVGAWGEVEKFGHIKSGPHDYHWVEGKISDERFDRLLDKMREIKMINERKDLIEELSEILDKVKRHNFNGEFDRFLSPLENAIEEVIKA